MSKILIRSPGSNAWQQFLAEPDKQWRSGYSAKTLACCWEDCEDLPEEIGKLFTAEFNEVPELLIAIPEHKVPLPGGTRASQIDVFALLRVAGQTISVAVEGKVAEPFGPTLDEWLANSSDGKQSRLAFLKGLLGLPAHIPGDLRYQLLHRAGSAILEAKRFKTDSAAMIVHSFSPEKVGFDSYSRFLEILGVAHRGEALSSVILPGGQKLYVGWANGDQRYRAM